MKERLEASDVISIYNDALEKWEDSRDEAEDNYKFFLGEQWTDAEKKYLIKHGRTPMVFNKVVPRLHNLLGSEQMNRTDIIFRPQFNKYNMEAQLIQNIWRTVANKNNINDKLILSWFEALIMPIPSFIETTLEQDEYGYLDYKFEAVSGLDVLVDPEYTKYDMSDCRYIIKTKWMSKEEIIDKYGKDNEDIFDKNEPSWWQQLTSSISGFLNGKDDVNKYYDKENGLYKIFEYQERILINNVVVLNEQTNEMYEVSKKEYNENKDSLKYMVDRNKKRIEITVVIPYYNEVLFRGISPLETDMFNIIPICSFDLNHKKCESLSVVSLIKDIQKNYNKRQSQYTNILDNATNSPLIVDQQDEELKRDYEQRGNKPGNVFISKASSKSRPYRLQGQNADPNIMNDMQNMEMQFNDISAITPAMQGSSESSGETGRLFQLKVQASSASVNPYFHNLTKSRILLGKYFLDILPQVYGDENRIVGVINKTFDKPEEIIINLSMPNGDIINNIKQFKGFVIADEGKHSVTEQEKQFETKFAIMQAVGNPQLINWEWMLKDSGIADVNDQINFMNQMLGIQSQEATNAQAIQNQSSQLDNALKAKDLIAPQQNTR